MTARLQVFGLFPGFEGAAPGGVQLSARYAWEGIAASTEPGFSEAFFHEPGASRSVTVWRAVTSRRRSATVLVWHVHLLKLVPFAVRSRARIVLFLHGIEVWTTLRGLIRQMLKHVNLVLSNSDHTWANFVRHNPDCANIPHETIHLGCGFALSGPAPEPEAAPLAIMIARMSATEGYKGHREVIDAWPRVLRRVPDARLVVVGRGDLRPQLEGMAEARVPRGSVTFLGQACDDLKEFLLCQARCLLLPSRGEGFGLVYLEAMRAGRPCLVSDVDAGREVVNPPEAGLAVNPADVEATSDAIVRLLTPGPEWSRWSTCARARYESRFTGAHFQRRLMDALRES